MTNDPIDPDEYLADAQLPDPSDEIENVDDDGIKWIVLDEGYGLYEWHPLRDGQGKTTEVHIAFRNKEIGIGLVMRLKSPRAVNELIAVLRRHRDSVWGRVGAP